MVKRIVLTHTEYTRWIQRRNGALKSIMRHLLYEIKNRYTSTRNALVKLSSGRLPFEHVESRFVLYRIKTSNTNINRRGTLNAGTIYFGYNYIEEAKH